MPSSDVTNIEWQTSPHPIAYQDALDSMHTHVDLMKQGTATERIWLLEHEPVYTAGTSAQSPDLLDAGKFPVFETGRGGEYTYHGPGQRIAYVMLDLNKRNKKDIRAYIRSLEEWVILTLAEFGIKGERREGRIGIWVVKPDGSEAKIAAIGVRISKWITFHGIALNINPNLDHYKGIVPCGIAEYGVTSFEDLGVDASFEEVDNALKQSFEHIDL